jgi:pimeloyl-ACP methyl ester carboxylesterase
MIGAVTMPDAGHLPMMEDPDTFNRLLAEAIEGFKG